MTKDYFLVEPGLRRHKEPKGKPMKNPLIAAPKSLPPSPRAEFRDVTVLFADMTGFTTMAERMDPEDVRSVVAEVTAAATKIVESFDGRIDRVLGDEVMAVFGDPAHEDDAVRAIRAAIELHEAVERMGQATRSGARQRIALHSGINTGRVVTQADHSQDSWIGPLGDAVNVAARLRSLAGAGEILVGPTTHLLAKSFFEFEDRGVHELKGRTEPIQVSRVVGAVDPVHSLVDRSPLIGRQEEFGILLGAMEALRDGETSVVRITGDAGVGKTRLVEEFRSSIEGEVTWLEGRGFAYGASVPFSLIVDLLNRSLGIGERDNAERVRAKLTETVETLVGVRSLAVLPPLLVLYDLGGDDAPIDRESFKGFLLSSVVELLEALAGPQPTVLCLRDLHWADPSSIWLLHAAIAQLRVRVVAVLTHRPGIVTSFTGERVVHLDPLSQRQVELMLSSLLDDRQVPAAVVEAIISRTEGNPFFVEEIVNTMVETGALVRGPDGWAVGESLDLSVIPTSVRGVISARIDRLNETDRRVLREASVIGREFKCRVVSRVASMDDVRLHLDAISDADLIREKATDSELEYRFKHALTQEVAYDGLLNSERRMLHARVAAALEEVFSDRLGEHTETLAHHYERSGLIAEAVRYRSAAGRKALDRYAISEAHDHYLAGYRLLTERSADQPSIEQGETAAALVQLILDWSIVHYYSASISELSQILERHEQLVEAYGDPEQAGLWEAWTGVAAYIIDGVEASRPHLDRAIALGEQEGSARVLAYAHCWRPWMMWRAGHNEEAIEARRRVAEVEDELENDPYPRLQSLGGVGLAHAQSGNFAEARAIGEQLISEGHRNGNPRATGLGHITLAHLSILTADMSAAMDHCDMAAETAQDPWYELLSATWRASASIYDITVGPADERLETLGALLVDRGLSDGPQLHRSALPLRNPFQIAMATAEGGIMLQQRQLSSGWGLWERTRRDARTHSDGCGVTTIETAMSVGLARVATGEIRRDPRTVLRNPLFSFRNSVGLARRARRRLDELSEHLEAEDQEGFRFIVEFERAKLLVHMGDSRGATEALARAIEAVRPLGDTAGRREAQALARLVAAGTTSRSRALTGPPATSQATGRAVQNRSSREFSGQGRGEARVRC